MHSTLASEGRQAAMDDSGTVVVAATNARLAIVAGLSLVTESAAAHGRRESSIACSVQSGALAAPDFVSCPPRVDTTAKRPRPALMLAETPQYPRARAELLVLASVLLPLAHTTRCICQSTRSDGFL
jgi:hypothetical protein